MYVPTWAGMAPATMRFNEALTNGLLIQPSNAFTNLAYIVAGLFLLFYFRKDKNKELLFAFAAVSFLTGTSSFLYHASNAFLFQVFDLGSMYLLSSLLLTLNLSRLTGERDRKKNITIFIFAFAVPAAVLLVIRGRIGAVLFGIEILIALVLEIAVHFAAKGKIIYRDLVIAWALFLTAFGFWLLDIGHFLFSPENHVVQGHGLWHIINSVCFIFLYLFYRQFSVKAGGRAGKKPVGITNEFNRS